MVEVAVRIFLNYLRNIPVSTGIIKVIEICIPAGALGRIAVQCTAVAGEQLQIIGHADRVTDCRPVAAVGRIGEAYLVDVVRYVVVSVYGVEVEVRPEVHNIAGERNLCDNLVAAVHNILIVAVAAVSGHVNILASVVVHTDTDVAVVELEGRQTGIVTGLHTLCIKADRRGTGGSLGTHCQRIAGEHDVRGNVLVVQAEIAVTLGHRPCLVIRVVIPLPFKLELIGAIAEIITLCKNRTSVIGVKRQGGRCLSVDAHHRPVILEVHGNQNRNPAHAAVILEQDTIPLAVRRIYNTALCNTGAIGTKSGLQNSLALVGAFNILAAVAELDSRMTARPSNDEYIVVITDLLDMGAFASEIIQTRFENGLFQTALLETGHLSIELLDLDLTAAAVYKVIPAVVIKHHGGIVVHTIEFASGPGAVFDVGGLVNVGLIGAIAAEEGVEHAVLIAQTGRPLAMCVIMLAVREILDIAVRIGVIDIVADLPGHQVIGLHDRRTRREVHGRAHHVIGITNTDDIRIRYIRPDKRVRNSRLRRRSRECSRWHIHARCKHGHGKQACRQPPE